MLFVAFYVLSRFYKAKDMFSSIEFFSSKKVYNWNKLSLIYKKNISKKKEKIFSGKGSELICTALHTQKQCDSCFKK